MKSFGINPEDITPGIYKHSRSGFITTWDVRIKKPDNDKYLTPAIINTIEHTLSDYLRNRYGSYRIIGAFPMGCQTGFYVLTRFINKYQIHEAIKDYAMHLQMRISIPGANKKHKLQNLKGAKEEMLEFYDDFLRYSESAINYNLDK